MPRYARPFCFALIAIIFAASAFASTPQEKALERQLSDKLVNSRVLLRNFYEGSELRYDSTGALISKAKPGPWTLNCYLEITKVIVNDDVVRLVARRLGVMFDHKNKKITFTRIPDLGANIEVALPKERDLASVDGALSRVFLRTTEPIEKMVPQEWQWFLQNPFAAFTGGPAVSAPKPKYIEAPPTGERIERPAAESPHDPDMILPDGTPVFRAVGQATPIYKVKPGLISPPRVIFSPDPEYPPLLRHFHVEGTSVLWAVIGADGSVVDLVVQRPFGLGLDESAVEAVRQWRFEPAKREGQPVAVQINIEVNFRMYR